MKKLFTLFLACLMFGSAAWKCEGRDKFIGWSNDKRRENLRYMTNNSRYLIFPWVKVPHLASHILSLVCRRISSDWVVKYGHPIYALETYVECERLFFIKSKSSKYKDKNTAPQAG